MECEASRSGASAESGNCNYECVLNIVPATKHDMPHDRSSPNAAPATQKDSVLSSALTLLALVVKPSPAEHLAIFPNGPFRFENSRASYGKSPFLMGKSTISGHFQ
eukprot:s4194_g5.t1